MKNGIYIYGIIKADGPQEFGEIGIGNKASQVLTLEFKDISAVISRSPLVTYNSLDKEKTIKDLVSHQFVIETVMKRCTIMPVKFGTIVETEEDAIQLLEKGYSLLSSELSKMEGKIELDVVATWELPKILATLSRHNSQLQKKQEEIVLKGDKVSIEDKVEVGKFVEQALKTQKIGYHQRILQVLTREALDICPHDLAHDEMVFNAAFLLAKAHEEPFTQAVTRLDQELNNSLNFRMVGPLPAYSFSTILLELMDTRKLEEAKATLNLHGNITAKAVRDAYYQLAQKCHPDTKGDGNSLKFHHLNAAYRTLKYFVEHGLTRVEVYRWEKDMQ